QGQIVLLLSGRGIGQMLDRRLLIGIDEFAPAIGTVAIILDRESARVRCTEQCRDAKERNQRDSAFHGTLDAFESERRYLELSARAANCKDAGVCAQRAPGGASIWISALNPSSNGDAAPNGLHNSKRPSALNEAIGRA